MNPVSQPLPSRLWIIHLAERIGSCLQEYIKRWPKNEKDHLGDQLTRSIDSIGSNISEGYVRLHPKERLLFYSYAQGSIEESIFDIRRAFERGLLTRLEASTLSELLMKLSKAFSNFKEKVH